MEARKSADFLKKTFEEKQLRKQEAILKEREEKLNKFRIQFIPLCCDEDMERLSEYFGDDSDAKTDE
jgi:hypothetical protein